MTAIQQDMILGIVLYKEEIQTSNTFISLVRSIEEFAPVNPVKILIFDNTPRTDKRENEIITYNCFIDLYYITENENKGLPYAYNLFAEKAKDIGGKWIVLLDQDTELPFNFYKSYLNVDTSIPIHCPLVFSNNVLMSPAYYKNFRSYPMQIPITEKIDLKEVSCINSGLMINVDFFCKVGGYNPNLFLDFCDHDFIHNLKKLKVQRLGIIKCELHQDFSSINHSKEQAITRYKLFVKDLIYFYEGKSLLQIFFFVDLPRLLKLTFQYRSLEFLKIRFT